MRHAGPFLQVADGELDHRVVTVVSVQEDDTSLPIGDEGVVAPGDEQLGLVADDLCAAHDEAVTVAVVALGHLRLAAHRVVDRRPTLLGDGLDGPHHRLVLVDGDGVAHMMVTAGRHHVLRVEPQLARSVSGPVAPHRRTRPITSRTKRGPPRPALAEPLRWRMWRTSPVSARVATRGCSPSTLV